MTIFVDTSAWYALVASDDEYHDVASRTLQRLAADRTHLITHNYVVVETLALVHRRLGMASVRRFVADVVRVADIEWIQPSLHDVAMTSFLDSGPAASFVDHISFAVMRTRGVATAFAFDADFAAQGFELLQPASH